MDSLRRPGVAVGAENALSLEGLDLTFRFILQSQVVELYSSIVSMMPSMSCPAAESSKGSLIEITRRPFLRSRFLYTTLSSRLRKNLENRHTSTSANGQSGRSAISIISWKSGRLAIVPVLALSMNILTTM